MLRTILDKSGLNLLVKDCKEIGGAGERKCVPERSHSPVLFHNRGQLQASMIAGRSPVESSFFSDQDIHELSAHHIILRRLFSDLIYGLVCEPGWSSKHLYWPRTCPFKIHQRGDVPVFINKDIALVNIGKCKSKRATSELWVEKRWIDRSHCR